jgi:hypothetical protein
MEGNFLPSKEDLQEGTGMAYVKGKGRQQRRQKREKAKRENARTGKRQEQGKAKQDGRVNSPIRRRREESRPLQKRPQHDPGTHTQRQRVGTLGKENRPRNRPEGRHYKDARGGALRAREGFGNLIARGTSVCYAARESSPVEGVSNGIL